METTLPELWAELLHVEKVGRYDNFFELGGHSLLAVSLAGRMREAGLSGGVRAIFACPTLTGLAAAVAEAGAPVEIPENRIPDGCSDITPEMLPLVALTPEEIDCIASAVPGGAV